MSLENTSVAPATASVHSPRIAARFLRTFLPAINAGHLVLMTPAGERIDRAGDKPGTEATLVVHHWRALWRMLRHGETGFTDGYMAGEWSTPDLAALLEFCVQNESALATRADPSAWSRVMDRLHHWRNRNTPRGSRRNIAAHYDLGNAFYREWLDASMSYSSAIYAGDETLEQAQQNKLARIGNLLELAPGQRVLEIGAGWGGLAEYITQRENVAVTGITLSSEQLEFAEKRLPSAEFRLQDYRDINERFDRIVSIEMIEAVGEQYWPTYFAKLRSCLTDTGVAVLQVITIDESRFDDYRKRPDFIQRHIFPGGMLPTLSIVAREAARAGLKVVHQETFGKSYEKTLCEWRMRFLHAWPRIEAQGFDKRFQRMWEYYLAYCEAGFRQQAIDVALVKLAPADA